MNLSVQLCRKCGTRMTEIWPDHPWHPMCAPKWATVPGFDYTYGDLEIIESVKDVVTWAQDKSDRSQQVALGCSEIGDDCQRRIAMTMVGLRRVNYTPDPWPSTVGTAIHTWLSDAINAYQLFHGNQGWLSELEIMASDWLPGHVDLYRNGVVLDLKNPSRTNHRKMAKEGIGDRYLMQIMGYGKGVKRSGRKVERVGILSIPRDGNLSELWCKTFEFDEALIDSKIAEIETLADTVVALDVMEKPENWAKIAPTPSRMCGWCPHYDPALPAPGLNGCPGRLDDPIAEMFR